MSAAKVETASGWIEGSVSGDIVAFRGVPFAAAPVGARRFMPPQAPEPWAGVRETKRPGPSAPQLSMPAFSWINAAAGALDEDCLHLNVWTPALDGARRPVMVWIHGGGFLVGSGSTVVYDGTELARRGDVVVVSLNYRLGATGFSHLSTVFPEELPEANNLGTRDQIAALEWVRDHIDRFGGDPGNVTVFGQSAGGMSVGALLGAPRARKLFHRAICMSGAADHVLSRTRAHVVAEKLLHELGGPSPSNVVLGRIPIDELLAAQNRTMLSLSDLRTLMCFTPCADGELIPEQPLDALSAGAAAGIPIMTGATLEEWKLFGVLDGGIRTFSEEDLVTRFSEVLSALPSAPTASVAARRYKKALGDRTAAYRDKWVWHAFQSARVFHWPSAKLAEAQHEGGGRAWQYLVTWRAPAARRALGSCHAIDIPFVFGTTGNPLARPLTGLGSEAGRLSRNIMDAWVAFARAGDPGHEGLPEWPHYEPGNRYTMILGRSCELAEAPLEAERRLLEVWGRGYEEPQVVTREAAAH